MAKGSEKGKWRANEQDFVRGIVTLTSGLLRTTRGLSEPYATQCLHLVE